MGREPELPGVLLAVRVAPCTAMPCQQCDQLILWGHPLPVYTSESLVHPQWCLRAIMFTGLALLPRAPWRGRMPKSTFSGAACAQKIFCRPLCTKRIAGRPLPNICGAYGVNDISVATQETAREDRRARAGRQTCLVPCVYSVDNRAHYNAKVAGALCRPCLQASKDARAAWRWWSSKEPLGSLGHMLFWTAGALEGE